MSEDDNLFSTAGLMKAAESDAIALWDDTKKRDFVGLFQGRVRVARYLLEKTAHCLKDAAEKRKFLSRKHEREMFPEGTSTYFNGEAHYDKTSQPRNYNEPATIGGRTTAQLQEIVDARVKEILANLPPLQMAVEILDPDTAAMIVKRDALLERGQATKDALMEASESIIMAEFDHMKVSEFRAMVKERDAHRKSLLGLLSEIGTEGNALEMTIAKRLYAGLPGLSDAVIRVVKDHLAQSTALDALSRRVEEQVLFGDNEAALSLLRHFEKDEVQVATDLKAKFEAALEELRVAVHKKAKRSPKKVGDK